jgi:hypothetical protein
MLSKGTFVAVVTGLVTLSLSAAAAAQSTQARGTLGASYSILHIKDDGDAKTTSVIGWVVTLTHNLIRYVGVVADVDGHYQFKSDYEGYGYSVHGFAGGVRVGGGSGRVEPWGQVVAGLAHLAFSVNDSSENDLLISFGGGADIKFQGRCRARAQIDFPYTRSSETGYGTTRGYRISGGIAVGFGG